MEKTLNDALKIIQAVRFQGDSTERLDLAAKMIIDGMEAERGKSAKLVEAFEEIKAMKIYGNDDTDQGFESEADAYREIKYIAKNALEAYKEGKEDE